MGINYGFLNHCVQTAEETFSIVINKKSAKLVSLQQERNEVEKYIQKAYFDNEISKNEFDELSNRINKIDFTKIPEIREKIKESEKRKTNLCNK